MITPDVAALWTLYRKLVEAGFVPLGSPVGTGRRSALQETAQRSGWEVRRVRKVLEAAPITAIPSVAPAPPFEKPRFRVRAGSGPVSIDDLPDKVLAHIRRQATSAADMAARWGVPENAVRDALGKLHDAAVRVHERDGLFSIMDAPLPAGGAQALHAFQTARDNTFIFGACGDQHAGSKYHRPEVTEALYDAFAEAGCSVVFNTGNWIDGEARFNKHDLTHHGMDSQVRHLAAVYPRRTGITTYAVAGDDHEGWYAQNDGIDIGRYAERTMRDAGRTDWVDLGYMEAPVRIVNASSGKDSIISVVHPGGGSAYALSYTMQKIVESLDGGEKPAILLAGHYHKLWFGNVRNVWVAQTGTSQDQTPFMRKKRLEAHVGGVLMKATQDPATGAIVRCQCEILRFFNRGYYANRWSHSGPVTHSPRAEAA